MRNPNGRLERSGKRKTKWKNGGKYGLGKRNDRGESLVNFCKRNAMIVGNTLFQQYKRRRYTWTCPRDESRYQIGYNTKDSEIA